MYTHEETGNDWVRKENLSVKNWFDENQIELIESPTNGVISGLKSRDEWIKIKNQRLLSDVMPSPVRVKKIENFRSDLISRKSIIFEDNFTFNMGGYITYGTDCIDLTFTEFALSFGIDDVLNLSGSDTGTVTDLYII